MRQKREYKSPYAALLWSMVLPGCGQLYNKDYCVGIILIGCELLVNLNSNLNLALLNSFNGDVQSAHQVIDYRWAMFYPSLYGFALWHAFNSAKANNFRIDEKVKGNRTYLTGFFIGMVVGMDFGLFWHDYPTLRVLDNPVFNGLICGLILGLIGCLVENAIYRRQKAAKQTFKHT
jgi:hypothetical protein